MLTRREFINLCVSTALTASLTDLLLPVMRSAYAQNEFQPAAGGLAGTGHLHRGKHFAGQCV